MRIMKFFVDFLNKISVVFKVLDAVWTVLSDIQLEPPNKGHYGANDFVPRRAVVPISEVK